MTIGVHLNQQKVPFAKFMKSFRGMSVYDDELKIKQSSSFEGIYMDDSNEGEIGLYALETIPKVETLSQMDQKIQKDDDQPTPCVLTEGEIVEHVSKIQLRLDLRLEKRKKYEDLLRKYIHSFTFNYNDLNHGTTQN